MLNFPNNDFLSSSASFSRWHSNWLCVDVLFITLEKMGEGSKLKRLLRSINLHEKIIKGVGRGGGPGIKWKLNSFKVEMIHCVVCNAWCTEWTGAKSIRNFVWLVQGCAWRRGAQYYAVMINLLGALHNSGFVLSLEMCSRIVREFCQAWEKFMFEWRYEKCTKHNVWQEKAISVKWNGYKSIQLAECAVKDWLCTNCSCFDRVFNFQCSLELIAP